MKNLVDSKELSNFALAKGKEILLRSKIMNYKVPCPSG